MAITNRHVNTDVYLCNERAKAKPLSKQSSELGKRERQIAQLVSQEKGNEEIAFELGTSRATVVRQVYNVMQKIGAKSRVGVALWWIQNGNSQDQTT